MTGVSGGSKSTTNSTTAILQGLSFAESNSGDNTTTDLTGSQEWLNNTESNQSNSTATNESSGENESPSERGPEYESNNE